ncbi:MAG: helix-turn-helix transcriptional regulator [Porphyromonas sp.]|nr:helix-turn-helix transcriptional regulator [Porphyromonas sp.]
MMTDNRGIDAGQIRDRIQYIIDQLRLKPSSFADLCELPRSTISNILNGKSNATLDVLNRIITSFPDWSEAWILFGKGGMYNSDRSLFDEDIPENKERHPQQQGLNFSSPTPDSSGKLQSSRLNEAPSTEVEVNHHPQILIQQPNKSIEKIIVFYTDNSYQAFFPSENAEEKEKKQ